MDKKAIRDLIREKKRAMSEAEICRASAILAEKLAEDPLYRQAASLYGYLSYNQEVRTMPILERALREGKRVAVPKVYGQQMRFVWLRDLSRVAKGYAGILEPVDDEPVARDPTALVLMPGLAFDRQGHRIGYGGGFYDRFLAVEPNHPTVALCYGFQLFPTLPAEAFDIAVDRVIWD